MYISFQCFSDISTQSSEILFEVWDQGQKIGKSDTFMGLGIGKLTRFLHSFRNFA